jgi:DNA-binding transcriptional ArsR family regulator
LLVPVTWVEGAAVDSRSAGPGGRPPQTPPQGHGQGGRPPQTPPRGHGQGGQPRGTVREAGSGERVTRPPRAVPGTPSLMRAINEGAALRALLERGALTRPELGALIGLSKPTTSQLLARLRSAGLVVLDGIREGGPGRTAEVYRLNAAAAFAAGLDVAPARIVAAVGDLTGNVVGEETLRTPGRAGGDVLKRVRAAVEGACRGAESPLGRPTSSCCGCPMGWGLPLSSRAGCTGGPPAARGRSATCRSPAHCRREAAAGNGSSRVLAHSAARRQWNPHFPRRLLTGLATACGGELMV